MSKTTKTLPEQNSDENKLPAITHPEQKDGELKKRKVSLRAILDTKRIRTDGTYTVKIRVVFNRLYKIYSTKINVNESDFLEIAGNTKDKKLREKKVIIYDQLKKAAEIIYKMKSFSFEDFEKSFYEKKGAWESVHFAFEHHINELKSKGQISTASTYQTAFNSIKHFHSDSNLKFKDITVSFLKDYENWLLASTYGKNKKKTYSPTTVSMNTRCLRKLFNLAIFNNGVEKENYPFGNDEKKLYQPAEANNVKKALSKADVLKIIYYEAEEGSPEEFYRDLFNFSYTANGMNMADIARLKYSNINNNEISFIRKKISTKRKVRPIIAPIDEDMQKIIDRFGTKPVFQDNYIFNILTKGLTPAQERAKILQATKMCNKYLKRIAKKIGIDENISTYYARHSFASVLKLEGEDISYISESLGHSNIKTTENYLSSFDSDKRKASNMKLK